MKNFLDEMKTYIRFTQEDQKILKEIAPIMKKYIPQIVDEFYAEIKDHDGTMKVITGGDAQIERLKGTLSIWLEEFFEGEYDEHFAEQRFKIGYRHVDVELDQKYMISAMGLVEKFLAKYATEEFGDAPEKLEKIIVAIEHASNLNLNLMCETYTVAMHEKLAQKEKEDLESFLKISGMSKKLYEKMAKGFNSK